MCIYSSSPVDQKGPCCTSVTSVLMQCKASCQSHISLHWNLCCIPAGQCCCSAATKVSHRRISPTERNQGEDSAWDLFFHISAVSGFKLRLMHFFGRSYFVCLAHLCSTDTKKYQDLSKILTVVAHLQTHAKYLTQSRLGRAGEPL